MTINPIEQFRNAIQSAGLIPPGVIEPDGKLRRFSLKFGSVESEFLR